MLKHRRVAALIQLAADHQELGDGVPHGPKSAGNRHLMV
jgi:hypothetical protein